MAEHSVEWWRTVPCHFTWNLEVVVQNMDFKSIVNNLDSKLEMDWEGSPCPLLLFRGYLEVSTFEGVTSNREKAEKFFQDSDIELENVSDCEEKKAYTIVSLANRLWILEKFGDGVNDKTTTNRETLIRRLEEVWGSPYEVSDQLKAHLEAIAGFALSRLGPSKYKEAEERYRKAIDIISTQSSWWHSLGLLIGRQIRMKSQSWKECYPEMDEEIHCYEKAIKLDPENDSARCDLALLLLKIPGRKEEARQIIGLTKDKTCEIIIKKGRFYRRQGEFLEALYVLQKGEGLKNPRSELFFQISCIYFDLVKQAGRERNHAKKAEYILKEKEYLDECLRLEPTHLFAKINKAKSYGKLRKVTEGEELFREIIEEQRNFTRNLIAVKFSFAKYLLFHNKRRSSEEYASLLEDVFHSSLGVQRELNQNENKPNTCREGEYFEEARKMLVEFYRTQEDGEHKIRKLEEKISSFISEK